MQKKSQILTKVSKKQLKIIKDNIDEITDLSLKFESKNGYLQLYLDNHFKLIESSEKFIEGDFDREEFTERDIFYDLQGETVIDAFFIYFSLQLFDNKTKWNVKLLILLVY